MTCSLCKEFDECPFCEYTDPDQISVMVIPQRRQSPIEIINLPSNWAERQELYPVLLRSSDLSSTCQQHVIRRSWTHTYTLIWCAPGRPNLNIFRPVSVFGDALLVTTNNETGEDVNLPGKTDLWFKDLFRKEVTFLCAPFEDAVKGKFQLIACMMRKWDDDLNEVTCERIVNGLQVDYKSFFPWIYDQQEQTILFVSTSNFIHAITSRDLLPGQATSLFI